MYVSVIAGIIVLYFIGSGMRQGALKQIVSVIALVASYVFAGRLAFLIQEYISWQPPIFKALIPVAYLLLAAILIFLGVMIAAKIVVGLFKEEEKEKSGGRGKKRFFGALVGAVIGCCVVVFLAWSFSVLGSMSEIRKVRQTRLDKGAKQTKTPAENLLIKIRGDIEGSRFGKVAQKIAPVNSDVYDTLNGLVDVCGEPKALKRFRKYPPVERLSQHPKFKRIIESKTINEAVANMDFKSLLDSEPIAELLKDKELIDKIKEVDWKEAVAFAKSKKE